VTVFLLLEKEGLKPASTDGNQNCQPTWLATLAGEVEVHFDYTSVGTYL
jgi:hypothetical protein